MLLVETDCRLVEKLGLHRETEVFILVSDHPDWTLDLEDIVGLQQLLTDLTKLLLVLAWRCVKMSVEDGPAGIVVPLPERARVFIV